LTNVTTLTYANTGLTANTGYYYKVRTYSNTGGLGEQSLPIAAGTLPGAPTTPSAAALSSTSINIAWTAPDGGLELEYKIYRSTASGGTYVLVGASAISPYIDTELTPNTTLYYKVSAANSTGEGAQTAAVNALTWPSAPTNLSVTKAASDGITLSWTTAAGATRYKIYRADSSDGPYTLLADIASAATYTNTVTSADLGARYYYKVSAHNASNSAGEGELSDYVYGTVENAVSIVINIDPMQDIAITNTTTSIKKGTNGTFSISGSYILYRWYLNGVAISGATASGYSFTTADKDPGVYELMVVVTSSEGKRLSARLDITITN
jgi:fibronectin type 3 domain-containing protein